MRKEIADLSVRFGADGTRGLTQDIERVKNAIGKLKAVSFDAMGKLGGLGVGLGAGALAGVGALTALAAANDDYVERISKLSNLSGMQLDSMSRLAAAARRYGVDLDTLQGALGSFVAQVADGASGGAMLEEFEKLGIGAEQLAESAKDPLKALLQVAEAQKKLSGAERNGILNKLFGGDSVKIITLLDAMAEGSQDVVDAIGKIDDAGAIVTIEDVKLSREFNNALGEVGDVMRGLSLEIGRTVLPTIGELVSSFAGFVRNNRDLINGNIAGAWRRVGGAIQTVVRYFNDGERAVKGTWLEPVVRWIRQIGETIGTTLRATGELFDVLGGGRQSGEFPWMADFASGVSRMAEHAVSAIDGMAYLGGETVMALIGYLGKLPEVVSAVEAAWSQLQAGFESGVGNGFLAETGKLFRQLSDGAIGVRDALIAIAKGEPVDPKFDWVQSAVTAFGDIASLTGAFLTTLVAAVGSVISNFDAIRRQLEDVFGVDITQMGLWIAFAQFSGVANTFLIAGGIVLSVLGSIAGAAVIGGIALGVFIAKMAEAHEWANAPFKAFVGFIDEMTGDAQRMRNFWDEQRQSSDEWLQQRAKLAGMSPDDFLAQGRAGMPSDLRTLARQPEAVPPVDMQELLQLAKSFTDGSALQAALQFQTSIVEDNQTRAETAGDASAVASGPVGTPVTIELSPTGEKVVVYSNNPDVASQLVDMVHRASRVSATQTAPSFTRPKK